MFLRDISPPNSGAMCTPQKYLNVAIASPAQTGDTLLLRKPEFSAGPAELFSPPVSPGSSISSDNTLTERGYAREREYKQLSNDTNGAAVKVETF